MRAAGLLVAVLTIMLAAVAAAAPPRTRTGTDPAGDQHHGAGWRTHPAARAEADLRRTTVAVRDRHVVITIKVGRLPARPRNGLELAVDLGLVRPGYTDQLDVSIDAGPGRRSEATLFIGRSPVCPHSVSASVRPARREVVARVPLRCLGRTARALTDPRTDSTLFTPDFTMIASDVSFARWRLRLP
ncbi:hypothetical protein GCM10023349_24660 [Nocardioides conyzicola]|uniref:Uncharacterized protein n=1 Tax=Nocardioides conyzicola TaxID=1651781 RepID=A0ABP8XEB0_9ACTN